MDIRDEVGLSVRKLSKTYPESSSRKPVFEDLSFELKAGERLAILGRNGQGKSTLIKILGGVLPPSSGEVRWSMSASWPIGFGGGFQGSLTGYDNIRFIARIYRRDYEETLHRVDAFAELGRALRDPVKHYSSGMRARLAFGLSLAIEFECYLIDELMAVGDARFARKCSEELFEFRGDRTFIVASHELQLISAVCDRALVLEGGMAKAFDDVDEAIDVYRWLRAP